MLKFAGVKKQYGAFVLDVSMEVKSGTVIGLIGANGAGKSTTFRAALNLIGTDSGEIRLFGKDVRMLTPQDKQKLGVVLSDSGFSEYLTVLDVAAILDAMYKEFLRERFLGRCEEFGLPLKKETGTFSYGNEGEVKASYGNLLWGRTFDFR